MKHSVGNRVSVNNAGKNGPIVDHVVAMSGDQLDLATVLRGYSVVLNGAHGPLRPGMAVFGDYDGDDADNASTAIAPDHAETVVVTRDIGLDKGLSARLSEADTLEFRSVETQSVRDDAATASVMLSSDMSATDGGLSALRALSAAVSSANDGHVAGQFQTAVSANVTLKATLPTGVAGMTLPDLDSPVVQEILSLGNAAMLTDNYYLDALSPLIEMPVVDVEFHEDGFAIWQDETSFYFASVDMATGQIDTILNVIDIAVPRDVVGDTWQGPEFVETSDGLAAVGTTVDGLIYFSATEGYQIPESEDMVMRTMPRGAMTDLRFTAVYGPENNQQYLYEDGVFTPLEIDHGWPRWLSANEMLVQIDTGFEILNLDTNATQMVAQGDYKSIHHFAKQLSDGERLVLLAEKSGGYSELYRDTASGWELIDTLIPPSDRLTEIYSPEIFEWQGRAWIAAYIGGTSSTGPSVQILYDIENQEWTQLSSAQDNYKDQEAVPLSTGQLSFVVTDFDDGFTKFQVFDPEDGSGADITLTMGVTDSTRITSRYLRSQDDDGVITISYFGTKEDVDLKITGFDIDTLGEVNVSLNGEFVGALDVTGNGSIGTTTLLLDGDMQRAGLNIVTISSDNAFERWGVFGLRLEEPPTAETTGSTAADAANVEFSPEGYGIWQDADAFYFAEFDMDTGEMVQVLNKVEIAPAPSDGTPQGPEFVYADDGTLGALGNSMDGVVFYTAADHMLIPDMLEF